MENIWQYLRANFLSNRAFDSCEAILDAGCEAWNELIERPDVITSIGMRKWAREKSVNEIFHLYERSLFDMLRLHDRKQ